MSYVRYCKPRSRAKKSSLKLQTFVLHDEVSHSFANGLIVSPSVRARRSYELGKEKFRSRVTAEPTKGPRAKNHRPILSYLILLRVAEPVDVSKRVESNKRKTNQRKRNNRTYTTLR
ncbi:hypothetical protein CBS147333_9399 [Penicillium roqueforti]|nr:hypothetical protein CBS147333_9399 [Penicillium roqueforti]KAI3191004.1 hypothetical protein CBS147311_9593 [Penicillium roqueforti]KAI3261154.1 hypothetical protein CBS147308_9985 [Penicillium roqueforti]KAI3277825.1 hypothetical protein DTO003C3_10063 [Penicillium roqueforti]